MYMNIPVDLAALDVRAIIGVEPEVDRDGAHKRDLDGQRLWSLIVTCKMGWEFQTLKIQFADDNDPQWDGQSMPEVGGLQARPWSKVNARGKLNGGVIWSAQQIQFNQSAKTPAKQAA